MRHTAIASKEIKGFYEIPGFSRYVVAMDGIVIDKVEMVVKYCGRNPAGYYNYFLYKDNGKRTTLGRHRLLGIVFKHPGVEIDELVINHKNGIKGDDRLKNLEWMTHQENIEHAGALGLSDKCLPVSVRDSYTGIVLDFPSIIECARYYDITKDAVGHRVRIGENRVFPEVRQYRFKSDRPWYIPLSVASELRRNRDRKGILVRSVFYDYVREYDSSKNYCDDSGLSPATVSNWLAASDQPIFPGLLQLKWAYDDTPWREVDDPLAEYNSKSGLSKIVQIEDDETKVRHYFLSAVDCSRYMGVKPTALDYRLKTQGSTVFSDGCRYMYYTASPTGQKWSDGILLN